MSKHTKRRRHEAFRQHCRDAMRTAFCTDGPVPPPCSDELHRHGTLMFLTHSIGGSNAIERWVKGIARDCRGAEIDWHFAGGRVLVKALGNLSKARAAIRRAMPEHDRMYRAEAYQYDYMREQYIHCPRPAWWTDDAMPEPDTAPRVESYGDGGLVLIDPDAAAMVAALGCGGMTS